MYSEWASLQHEIQLDTSNTSVLHSFPETVGREVACVVVRNLSQTLSLSATNSEPSNLTTDKQVRWTMEVLCYGLSLPLSEHEAIRDCVNVYCEWFSAMTTPKVCVPRPVAETPNPYVCDMLHHLYNLFMPRPDAGNASASTKAGVDLVKRQALLCHRVLRTVQAAATESTTMDRATWECVLRFLLATNNTLLATPAMKDNIGDHLCERVLSVLFDLWLVASARCFPSPPLWKTFRDMCATWRHHEALVLQWHRVNVVLASRLLKFTFGNDYPELSVPAEDQLLIPEGMTEDCIAQCWFRFLHILSNPVDLSRPEVISSTPKFLHMALTSESVIDPHQHACLRILPAIFFKAMRGISILVDAFLGISQNYDMDASMLSIAASSARSSVSSLTASGSTPPAQRKSKTFSLSGTSQVSKGSGKVSLLTPKVSSANSSSSSSSPSVTLTQVTLGSRPALAPARPKVNGILHLFGAWLFEAAIAGVKVHGSEAVDSTSDDGEDKLMDYEAGRAEACGTLCRIFCSHKTGEVIMPVYLSRFYIALYYGLQVNEPHISGQVLANIIFNSCDLHRIDLDGVMVLVPQILKALELILPDLSPRFKSHEQIAQVELRKASIHLLLSMLCLPLHYKSLPIKHIFDDPKEPPVTFLSLKMRMIELLLRALTVESDSANTQMLLGGLLLSVQDLAMCEEAEQTMVQEMNGSDDGPTSLTTHDSSGIERDGPRTKSSSTSSAGSDYIPYADTNFPRATSQLRYHDSAHGLFGHAASLVCNRLMASWKMDLNIALAAIEVLSGLAKVQLNNRNMLMCKRTVNWICEFIVYQCSRPAPAHSKDLHSMIVAAFHCLTLWLIGHDYLMMDKECLQGVLEVVELGISGSKSQPPAQPDDLVFQPEPPKSKHDKDAKNIVQVNDEENRVSDVPKLKGDKELKPVSLRVKDAAEALLTSIMEHVGSFPPPCGPESVCSLLDEDSLLTYCKDGGLPEQGTPFRYFVLEGATIVGLLEQPLGNDEDPLPTVTSLIRGPFGRHAWTLRLRHLPRHKKVASKTYLSMPKRPQPDNDVGTNHHVKHHIFPEIVDTIPLVEADKSIPRLEAVMSDQAADLEKLEQLIRDQMTFENKVKDKYKQEQAKVPYPDPMSECRPPNVSHDFQTARLFLSHYGFLSLEALKDPTGSSLPPSLVMLDTTKADFQADLQLLDSIPCRTSDTVFVFYVKSGQKTTHDILNNVTSKVHVQPAYLELLRSLGWPVDVKKHAGWTGHTSTSWRVLPTDESDEFYPGDTGGSLYDGSKQVLYWADVCSEVAFVVPAPDAFQPPAVRRPSLDSQTSQDGVFLHTPMAPPVVRLRCGTMSSVERGSIKRHGIHHYPSNIDGPKTRHMSGPGGQSGSRNKELQTPCLLSHRWSTSRVPTSVTGSLPGQGATPRPIPPDSRNTHQAAATEALPKGSRPVDIAATKPKSLSLDLERPPSERARLTDSPGTPTDNSRPLRRSSRLSTASSSISDTKIFVVWLEDYEDKESFPSEDLLHAAHTGLELPPGSLGARQGEPLYIIFIHALTSGLYRIHMQGQTGRISLAVPLVDGMVVSQRTLGSLVRQTAINICRRRRLENEASQLPHVRRKLKIKELVDKYRNKLIEPEFYTELFQDVSK